MFIIFTKLFLVGILLLSISTFSAKMAALGGYIKDFTTVCFFLGTYISIIFGACAIIAYNL